jgi:hypothetical protein
LGRCVGATPRTFPFLPTPILFIARSPKTSRQRCMVPAWKSGNLAIFGAGSTPSPAKTSAPPACPHRWRTASASRRSRP